MSSPQPNIFPKFLFHFADFPYELYIHQPEPAQLGNLLRFTVRARPGFMPKNRQFLIACIFKEPRGAPTFNSRLFANREVAKKRNPSSDSRSLLLGSNPFRRPLAVMGTRHLPPVSAWLSASVFISFWRHRSKTRLYRGTRISTSFFFGDPAPIARAPFHSRLPATPQLPTHSDRFKLHRKPFPSSVHKVLHSSLLVYLLLKPRSALETDPKPLTRSSSTRDFNAFLQQQEYLLFAVVNGLSLLF